MRLKNGEVGGQREGVCYIYNRIRGRESMILDGIQQGERESTKIYFSREVCNVLPEN